MTATEKFSVKTRYVWFTLADWRAFSDALAETYPQARYDIRKTHNAGPARPTTIWDSYLMDVPFNREGMLSWNDNVIMTFDCDWMPEYETFRFADDPPDTVRWKRSNDVTLPFAQFRRHTAPTPSQLAIMTDFWHSDIHYFCRAGDKAAEAEARHFFRLLGKFCTNRNQAHYKMPDWNLRWIEPKGSMYWFGHDAIRWAHGDPERAMYYLQKTWAIRPLTNEQVAELSKSVPTTPTA